MPNSSSNGTDFIALPRLRQWLRPKSTDVVKHRCGELPSISCRTKPKDLILPSPLDPRRVPTLCGCNGNNVHVGCVIMTSFVAFRLRCLILCLFSIIRPCCTFQLTYFSLPEIRLPPSSLSTTRIRIHRPRVITRTTLDLNNLFLTWVHYVYN